MEKTHITLDIITGVETVDVLPETLEEKKSREAIEAIAAENDAQSKINAAAKDALLTKLGITPDEAKLLLQ